MKEFIPKKYQIPVIEEMSSNDILALFLFPGAGKTVITLDKLYKIKRPTLIVASKELIYSVWLLEKHKWNFSENLKIGLLHGPNKDETFFKQCGIHIVTPDGLKWLINKIEKTRRFPWENLVIDESKNFKSPTGERFKNIKKIVKLFKRRYILSGNPTPNSYLDIWSQIYILDLGERLGKSFYGFRDKYFKPKPYCKFAWEILPGSKEEIVSKIHDIAIFMDPSSELDLPERIIIEKEIELDEKVMKEYHRMEKHLFAKIDDSKVLAKNTLAASLKCWQMASGFIYETKEKETDVGIVEERVSHFVHDKLSEAAIEIVDSLYGSPVLIAYTFLEDLARLKKIFPDAYFVTSGSSVEHIRNAEKLWNSSKIEILVSHINKFSHGLNLQFGKGHHIIFYGLTYNYDTFDQLIYRFERQGSSYKEVIAYLLKSNSTVHEAVIQSLRKKKDSSEAFLNSLKEYRENKIVYN